MTVAVTGLGLVTPLGSTVEETWSAFLRGESGIRPVDRFDASRYPSSSAGLVDRGPIQRRAPAREWAASLLLAAAEEAIRQSGAPLERACVVLGSTLGGMNSGVEYLRSVRRERPRPGLLRDVLCQSQAHELCDRHGIGGESLVVSDACTSGTNALGYAMRLLRRGDAEVALAGGYDPITEFGFAGFHSLQAISPDHCRPFDRNRKGLLLGEASAVFVLETEDHARRRGAAILGRLAGYGESADAHHITRPDPEARGAVLALRRALDDARISPADVGHVNAHGTGTPSNDPMEAAAIRQVFGEALVTANKAAIGHTLGAAGAVEAAVALLSLRDQVIPPTLHHEDPDPACAGARVVSGEPLSRRMKFAVSNSFGFGGSNAALVLAP